MGGWKFRAELQARQVDVTELTPSQRHEVIVRCLNQAGFTGFIKHGAGKGTYYVFYYEI